MEITINENIDLKNAYDIKDMLITKLDNLKDSSDNTLVINFSKTEFIDSTGLGILVSIHKKAKEKNIELKLINLNDTVKKTFKITLLDSIFNID